GLDRELVAQPVADPLGAGFLSRLVEEVGAPEVADVHGVEEPADGAEVNEVEILGDTEGERRNGRLLGPEHLLPGVTPEGGTDQGGNRDRSFRSSFLWLACSARSTCASFLSGDHFWR